MEYCIDGKVSFSVDFTVEAESEEEALKIAKEQLNDYYHLNVLGADHIQKSVVVDIEANEIED